MQQGSLRRLAVRVEADGQAVVPSLIHYHLGKYATGPMLDANGQNRLPDH
jgi:hypothetical protein